ncbi:hypothetical protein D3C79_1086300 [compost metagenome]
MVLERGAAGWESVHGAIVPAAAAVWEVGLLGLQRSPDNPYLNTFLKNACISAQELSSAALL